MIEVAIVNLVLGDHANSNACAYHNTKLFQM